MKLPQTIVVVVNSEGGTWISTFVVYFYPFGVPGNMMHTNN